MDRDQYCREIEAYLCRKNDGHLIRIVGPAFELVCGWAAGDIPLPLVFRGIDRCFERYYAKGLRRHPLRIDFCEADVLDLFDEWRRAVGVARAPGPESPAATNSEPKGDPARKRRPSLVAHLDGIVGRLSARPSSPDTAALDAEILRTLDQLDAMRGEAARLRGEARARLIDDLASLDRALGDVAERSCPEDVRAAAAEDAVEALEPFRQRMPPAAYRQALQLSVDRLLRERLKLPKIAYD